jgi:hypothetical protein
VVLSSSFWVRIEVSDVSDLYGWEFKLCYNTSLLELISIEEDTFLNGSRDTYFVPKNMSLDGYLLAGCTSLRNVAGVDGNGTIATVFLKSETLSNLSDSNPLSES